MKQKIKAYTLMEITIAMLLSAVCISMCYSAYGIITGYYKEFGRKNEASAALSSLKQVLARDFLNSKHALREENKIILLSDSITIAYGFESEWITRDLNQQHIDTFKVKSSTLTAYFEHLEVLSADTIDQVSFNVILSHKTVPIQVRKVYSAENLFN
jgi:Tfp pilus assembly protein PilE